MTARPDHELEVLEDDQNVPPRPEEVIADAGATSSESQSGVGQSGVGQSTGAEVDDLVGDPVEM